MKLALGAKALAVKLQLGLKTGLHGTSLRLPPPRRQRSKPTWFLLAGALFAALSVASFACTPVIGDKCTVSTDCSIRGDRLCDTSQPAGYCTQLNCRAGGCADEASCVLFSSAVPGCNY